jgi:hypothetical protein
MPRTNKPASETPDAPKPVRKSTKRNGAAASDDAEAVARRAYEIYQTRGGNHGADLDDWLEAERQVKGGPADVSAPATAKPRRKKSPEKTA